MASWLENVLAPAYLTPGFYIDDKASLAEYAGCHLYNKDDDILGDTLMFALKGIC